MTEAELQAQLAAMRVDDVLGGGASALAGLAVARLEAGDLPQAKRAIDAVATILGLLEDDGLRRDIGAALAGLQVAYADKV